MKIGIITTWFERGASYVSRQYKDLLEEAGHEVYIYARGGEPDAVSDSKWSGSNVTSGKRFHFPLPTYIDETDFKKWLLNNSIEVAFFNEQRWLKPVLLCRKLNIRTGLYVDYYTEDTIHSYGIFDFLICNTRKHFSAFKWHRQVYYIPWGTDIDLFNTAHIRRQNPKVRFFTSSGMNPYRKGTDLAIAAFVKARACPKFRAHAQLIIHSQISLRGCFSSRADADAITNNIDALQSDGSLRIYEGTHPAPGLYHEGDIYLYPSRLDGIGLTIAEAMACGMPVIVPNDGPMNEFLPEAGSTTVEVDKFFCRSDGYYWPQNEISTDDLARKLVGYVENRDNIPEYAALSRAHAIKNLNWRNNMNKIRDVFEASTCLTVPKALEDMASRAFTSGYPRITDYETVYKLMYLLRSFIKQ